jgi:hypothetical protein
MPGVIQRRCKTYWPRGDRMLQPVLPKLWTQFFEVDLHDCKLSATPVLFLFRQ